MNNNAHNVDFTRLLPAPLKNDESMLALAESIAGALQENIRLARLAVIYPRIDELDEHTLDILARDFHVDWYDDTYPIEAKRAVIKSSVRIHKRLGTKFAVVTAIGDIFPNSKVQEWFEYGGTHHHFRIILDLTNAKAAVNYFQILYAAQFYKRLSAHLDELVCKISASVEVNVGIKCIAVHKRIGAVLKSSDNSIFNVPVSVTIGLEICGYSKRVETALYNNDDSVYNINANTKCGATSGSVFKRICTKLIYKNGGTDNVE